MTAAVNHSQLLQQSSCTEDDWRTNPLSAGCELKAKSPSRTTFIVILSDKKEYYSDVLLKSCALQL